MINLYFHTSDPAKRKMLDWFHDQKIDVLMYRSVILCKSD